MKAFPSADFNFGASGSLVQMAGMKGGGGRTMVYFSAVMIVRQKKAGSSELAEKLTNLNLLSENMGFVPSFLIQKAIKLACIL